MLESNGTESELIKKLLRDVRLLGRLSKLLEDQLVTIRTLQGKYENKSWKVLYEQDEDKTREAIKKFKCKADTLADEVHTRLGSLTATSNELIQLVKQSIFSLRTQANIEIGI